MIFPADIGKTHLHDKPRNIGREKHLLFSHLPPPARKHTDMETETATEMKIPPKISLSG